ncbi:hypothetical protein N9K06_00665 [Omnitrophica bacterium]|nr:hypothetical protein [Candidatus Omnitrophota bacterium]
MENEAVSDLPDNDGAPKKENKKFNIFKLPGWIENFQQLARDFLEKFRGFVYCALGLLALSLIIGMLNGVNDVIRDKPMLIQYFVWTIIGGISFVGVGFVVYSKGKKDGMKSERLKTRGLERQLAAGERQIDGQINEIDKLENVIEGQDLEIEKMKEKCIRKDNAFHDLKDEIIKVKHDEVKEAMLAKWENACNVAEVAKERAQVESVNMRDRVEKVTKAGGKQLNEITKNVIGKAKDESEKGLNAISGMFKKKKNDKHVN